MARLFDDGSTEYCEVTSNLGISGYPFSISVWVYCDDLTINTSAISIANDGSTENTFAVICRGTEASDPVSLFAVDAGNAEHSDTTNGLTVNTWGHVLAIGTDSTDRVCIVDGDIANKGSGTTDITPIAPDATAIGRNCDFTPSNYFSGRVAEVGVWNVALPEADSAILAAGYSPLFVQPQNLVAYYPLIRDDNDRVGGFNMTAYNTPLWAGHAPIIVPAPIFYSFPSAAGAGWSHKIGGISTPGKVSGVSSIGKIGGV